MSYGDGLRFAPYILTAEHAFPAQRLKQIKACPCRLELEARLGGYQQRPAVTCIVYRTWLPIPSSERLWVSDEGLVEHQMSWMRQVMILCIWDMSYH